VNPKLQSICAYLLTKRFVTREIGATARRLNSVSFASPTNIEITREVRRESTSQSKPTQKTHLQDPFLKELTLNLKERPGEAIYF